MPYTGVHLRTSLSETELLSRNVLVWRASVLSLETGALRLRAPWPCKNGICGNFICLPGHHLGNLREIWDWHGCRLRCQYNGESVLGLVGLKRWRLVRNWLIFGFPPGVLLISNLFLRVTHLRYSFLIVAVGWMISTAYVVKRVQRWPCPSCGEPVMKKGWFHNDFCPGVCTADSL